MKIGIWLEDVSTGETTTEYRTVKDENEAIRLIENWPHSDQKVDGWFCDDE